MKKTSVNSFSVRLGRRSWRFLLASVMGEPASSQSGEVGCNVQGAKDVELFRSELRRKPDDRQSKPSQPNLATDTCFGSDENQIIQGSALPPRRRETST